jgi:threonine/homoserine/homoserine lactone efflux protein
MAPMRWELFLLFLSAALVVQLVPGPGMLFILANGIAGGPRAGIAAACGAASGMVVHTLAAALGLAALFAHAPAAYDVLRIVGGLYLIWIAIGHFRDKSHATDDGVQDGGGRSPKRIFARAWLNNLANPKVILFYLAFLPQFVAPSAGSVTIQLLVLGFVFLLIGLVIDLALGTFSGRIGDWLRQRAVVRKVIDRVAGTIMGGLGVRLLVIGRHS